MKWREGRRTQPSAGRRTAGKARPRKRADQSRPQEHEVGVGDRNPAGRAERDGN